MVLTDKVMEKLYGGWPVAIKGKKYIAVKEPVALGDLILDREDGCYGTVDAFHDEAYAAIRDEWAVQVGVPLTRLVKLQEKQS